jgi:hypothetical protein
MPLRNRLYLSDLPDNADNAADAALEARSSNLGWIKPLWILPRAWCVTTSLQAKGVPKHKTVAFVNLHLGRLAPFADYGVYACRSGDWVHLWFWENQRVRTICEKHNWDFASLQLAPESVCFPKINEGAVLLQCQQGVEAQLWHEGLLLDSAWWPDLVDKATWQKWLPTAAAATGVRTDLASWPETPPLISRGSDMQKVGTASLSEPWASNVLGKRWWYALKEIRGEKLQLIAGAALMLCASYLAAQWWTLQTEQRRVENKIETLSPLVEPLNAARSKAMESQQWVNKLAGLRSQDDVRDLLRSLQPVLQQQEAAIREFEYLDGEVRLMLAPIGTQLNIVTLTQELEALPKLSNIRLLPDSDARLTRISAKMVRLGTPSELMVLGQRQTLKDAPKTPSVQVDRSGKREKGE